MMPMLDIHMITDIMLMLGHLGGQCLESFMDISDETKHDLPLELARHGKAAGTSPPALELQKASCDLSRFGATLPEVRGYPRT